MEVDKTRSNESLLKRKWAVPSMSSLCVFDRWLNPLFKAGHKRRLEEDDMFSVLPEDRSKHLGEELQG